MSESTMIPRKRLDIGWRDLLFGMGQCLAQDRRAEAHAACRESTGDSDSALFFLSLRSGFDAYFQAARFRAGRTFWCLPSPFPTCSKSSAATVSCPCRSIWIH
jgi:hypothetical protein